MSSITRNLINVVSISVLISRDAIEVRDVFSEILPNNSNFFIISLSSGLVLTSISASPPNIILVFALSSWLIEKLSVLIRNKTNVLINIVTIITQRL